MLVFRGGGIGRGKGMVHGPEGSRVVEPFLSHVPSYSVSCRDACRGRPGKSASTGGLIQIVWYYASVPEQMVPRRGLQEFIPASVVDAAQAGQEVSRILCRSRAAGYERPGPGGFYPAFGRLEDAVETLEQNPSVASRCRTWSRAFTGPWSWPGSR